jgi:hypothetical protein
MSIGTVKGLPSIGYKFCYNVVVFLAAGFGAVLSAVVHFAADADEGSAGGFASAVLGELFAFVGHGKF